MSGACWIAGLWGEGASSGWPPFAPRGPAPWKLNLGCGSDRRPGYINVDSEIVAAPDECWDIERPWPLDDGSVSEIMVRHVLEHLHDLRAFFTEAYRVMRPGAPMHIHVPHHRSDFYWGDPTHVRPITDAMLSLLSCKACEQWAQEGRSNTPLATYWGVDFEIAEYELALTDRWREKCMTSEEALHALATFNNVASEVRFLLVRV